MSDNEYIETNDPIKVVYVEPGKNARTEMIKTDLKSLQAAVDGLIETYYPFEEPVCIVCNDEGKINRMPLNRGIRDEDGQLIEIIAGPFFICDCSTENFGSLSDEQINRYTEMFGKPERFFYNAAGQIDSKTYDPAAPGRGR